MLMKDIQAEQEELEQKLSALQSKISQQNNTEISIDQFRDTVRECLNVTELTPFILNKLINGIEIGCLEIVEGQKQQVVSVEWKFENQYNYNASTTFNSCIISLCIPSISECKVTVR